MGRPQDVPLSRRRWWQWDRVPVRRVRARWNRNPGACLAENGRVEVDPFLRRGTSNAGQRRIRRHVLAPNRVLEVEGSLRDGMLPWTQGVGRGIRG